MTGLLSKGANENIYISLQFKPGEAFQLDWSHYFTATFHMCLCHNRQTFRWRILKLSLLTACQYFLHATGVLHSHTSSSVNSYVAPIGMRGRRGNDMNLMNDDNNSMENQDDSANQTKSEKRHIPTDITLSHKEAEAGSPCDNSGEEDPGAALELLITENDKDDH